MELVQEVNQEWFSNFVATNSGGSFLQSWEWGDWQVRLGRTVFRFKILDNSGLQIASVQLVKMLLPLGQFYLYSPYGPVWANNFKFQISNFQTILNELISKFPNAVFIRIEPKGLDLVTSNLSLVTKSNNIQPGKTLVIDLTKTEEQLLSEMHHKTRYNIKVAQKHGVEIQDEFTITNGHGLFFDEALKLISETANRQGFKTFTPEYYKKMVDFFTLHHREEIKLHIYKAIFSANGGSSSGGHNTILATAFMLDFGNTRTFLFGGSGENNKNVMAPYLLHWKAIQDAKTVGLTNYDFWGIETSSGETPGFVRFKLGFGGREVIYGGAYDVVVNAFIYKLYQLVRKINKIIR